MNDLNSPNEKKYHDLLSRAVDISRSDVDSDESSVLISQLPTDPNVALSVLYQATRKTIANEQERYTDIFQTVENIIKENEKRTESFSIPSSESLRASFNKWVSQKLPVMSQPFAPLCGAMEFSRDRIVPPHSYACAPVDSEFFLVYVIGFDPETLCYHCCDADPDPIGPKLSDIIVPMKDLIPMPTSVPDKHVKGTYFPVKTRVLAMWSDNGQWTSAFYPATVASIPSESPGVYKLKFDGEPPLFQDVPEQMVVRNPNE